MADAPLAEDVSNPRDYIMRSHTRGLVDNQHTVHKLIVDFLFNDCLCVLRVSVVN